MNLNKSWVIFGFVFLHSAVLAALIFGAAFLLPKELFEGFVFVPFMATFLFAVSFWVLLKATNSYARDIRWLAFKLAFVYFVFDLIGFVFNPDPIRLAVLVIYSALAFVVTPLAAKAR